MHAKKSAFENSICVVYQAIIGSKEGVMHDIWNATKSEVTRLLAVPLDACDVFNDTSSYCTIPIWILLS